MSGHSKWATIKHKKGAADQKRAKLFAKLLRGVEVAAREGGGDIETNATLRTMYYKARDSSVPLENIERAIKRATGDLEGVNYEQITYEGYAPHGVALLVEVLTDNRNRTAADLRNILTKNGGSMAEPGAVAWQFTRQGVLMVDGAVGEDALMEAALEAGAEDIVDVGGVWQVTTDPSAMPEVRAGIEAAKIKVTSADTPMLPGQSVPLDSAKAAQSVLRVLDAIEDHDDVQDVYSNFDISDEIMEEVMAED